jgi:hypothetical protein
LGPTNNSTCSTDSSPRATASTTAGTSPNRRARRSLARQPRIELFVSRDSRAGADSDWSLRHTPRVSQQASTRPAAISNRSRNRCNATVNECKASSSSVSTSTPSSELIASSRVAATSVDMQPILSNTCTVMQADHEHLLPELSHPQPPPLNPARSIASPSPSATSSPVS